MEGQSMIDINYERFKRLPQQRGMIWQGGLVRLPMWLELENKKPTRVTIPLWADPKSHKVSDQPPCEKEPTYDSALKALIDFSLQEGGPGVRPFAIEVKDAALGAYLEEK